MRGQYPVDYFRPPVDFRMLLSGTFGELRSNHFHSGIDIKTNGRGGEKIVSIADGYVSRIKVSGFGFGKTLYITHPNGYVSVYAHLDRFNQELAEYTRKQHYLKESFEIDVYPGKDELLVKKGEFIGYSGNSGYSFGPHLHFEIREEATQKPVNPLLFGLEVKDYIRPSLVSMTVYPANSSVTVNGAEGPFSYDLEGWGEGYRLPGKDTVVVNGPVYFGIEAYDLLNDASNKNGVYSVELLVDGRTLFSFLAEKFEFSETRYINSLLDYAALVGSKKKIVRSKVDPNNILSMYGQQGEGILYFSDEGLHQLSYIVKDAVGNTSRLDFALVFKLKENERAYAVSAPPLNAQLFRYDLDNRFTRDAVDFEVPREAVYESFNFTYDTLPAPEGAFSRIHRVHDPRTPLHSYCTLRIKPDLILDDFLSERCLLATINEKGEYQAVGGEYKDGFVEARIRELGDYVVVADTVPPEIRPLSSALGKEIAGVSKISFKIRDELSGIREYRGELNGNWILMENDPKNDLLYYVVDDRMKEGVNHFKLAVTDMKGNRTEFETIWTR